MKKEQLIKKLNKYLDTRKDLIDDLKKIYNNSHKEDTERVKLIQKDYDKEELLEAEKGYRYAGNTIYPNYYYFVSNLGRFLLVRTLNLKKIIHDLYEAESGKNNPFNEIFVKGEEINNDIEKELEKNTEKNIFWFIPIKDNDDLTLDIDKFIEKYPIHGGCKFDSSTYIYKYVAYAWLNEQHEKIERYFKYEQIHTHHLTKCIKDCSEYNLMELPESIHRYVH